VRCVPPPLLLFLSAVSPDVRITWPADTDGLGLESVGIETRSDGTIVVDEFCNTSAEGIFALGDVIGSGFDLTPVAIAAGSFCLDYTAT